MRLRCVHGYFKFDELRYGQVSDFMNLTGLSLVSVGDHFTFESLAEAPDFSLTGLDLLGVPAIATFEGPPGEVFRENEIVYDFTKDLVVPIASIVRPVEIQQAGNQFISSGLILPGSLTAAGKKVTDYLAWFSRDRLSWSYSEVAYV